MKQQIIPARSMTIGGMGVLAAALTAGLAPPALAEDNSWIGGSGSWYDASSWSLGRVPELGDDVYIGDQPGQANGIVTLGPPGYGFTYLEIANGMTLDMAGGQLISFGLTRLMGSGTRLIVRDANGINLADFAGELQLDVGTVLDLRDNARMSLYYDSESFGTITGRGWLDVGNFSNSGVIRPDANGGIVLDRFLGSIDLDGSGSGLLQLDQPFAELYVNADTLNDPFSGTINMAPGALLAMNIAQGWDSDISSAINVGGFGNPVDESQITGSAMTFRGAMTVGGNDGRLRLHNDIEFQGPALVQIGQGDRLATEGFATIGSAYFYVGQDAQLDFNGDTVVESGSFVTASGSLVDGGVFFNGNTEWRGVVAIDGAARQNGDATVTGTLGASINANTFDMDGTLGGTNWQINGPLTVNADRVGTTAANLVDADIAVAGGFLPRLTINLTDPVDSWTLAGSLALNGSSPLYATKVGGSHMIMQGDMTVDGLVQITADTTFRDGGVFGNASVHIGGGDALRMQAQTRIETGVDFTGSGSLVNGVNGDMLIVDGTSLGQISLSNLGHFEIGDGAGIVGVHSFTQGAAATWTVSLGGLFAGLEHDQLLVTGGSVALGGLIEVSHLMTAVGAFSPNVGDEFTILTSLSGYSGSFLTDPVSFANGLTYEWDVLYNPNEVILRLAAVVPAPGSVSLLGLGLLSIARRNRRT